jgi:hypothetical protein
VYLLLGLDGAGQWYEVNQTEETHTSIAYQTLAKLHDLLLVAVGRQGIFTSAQVHVSEAAIQGCRPDSLKHPQPQQQLSLPMLQKLESDGVLFRAVISWSSPAASSAGLATAGNNVAAAQYLVRWRTIPEGFLAGSLLTNSTTATLALLADTTVQVEVSPLLLLLDNRQLMTSPPLLISTYRPAANGGSGGKAGAATTALLVAVFSLLLSLAAFLAMVIRLYYSRRSTGAVEDVEAAPSNINNSSISINNSSNNNISKLTNEDPELASRPLSPCLLQAKNVNAFKFPVNKMNFNEKMNSLNTEQSSSS